MLHSSPASTPLWCLRAARWAAFIAVVVGAVVLLGWLLDIDALKRGLRGGAPMKPNTALGFIALGLALALSVARGLTPYFKRRRETAIALAALAALIGVATLIEHALNLNLHIDDWWFRAGLSSAELLDPGRMAPITAASFVALGLSIAAIDARAALAQGISEALAVLGTLLGAIALVGYAYGVEQVYRFFQPYGSIAMTTAVLMVLIGSGRLLARPERALLATILSPNTGGMLARRVLPVAIGVTIVLGWLRLQGQRAGWYDTDAGVLLVTTGSITAFTLIAWIAARALNRLDQQRHSAEREKSRLLESLDQADEAMLTLDLDARITSWSAGATRLYGYSAQEAIGRIAPDLLVPQALRDEHENVLRRVRTGTGEAYEATRRTKSGKILEVEISYVPIRNQQAEVIGQLSLSRDITARKRAQELQSLAAAIVESSDDAIIGATVEGIVTGWNRGAQTLFGYTALEILGQDLSRLLPPDRLAEERSIMARVLAGERIDHLETTRSRKGGVVVPVSLTTSPIRDTAGQIIGVSRIARDITARIRAEQALHEEQARMRLIVEAAAHGVVMIDRDGKIALVNQQLERTFGYSRDELVGSPIEVLLPGELAANHVGLRDAYLEQARARPMGVGRDLYGRCKDGADVPLEVGLSPIEIGGHQYVLATVVDITERTRAQEAVAAERTLLRTLIDALPDVVFTKSPRGDFALCNIAELLHLGLEREAQVIGKSVFDFYPPEVAQRFHDDDIEVLAGRPVVNREEASIDGTGMHHWFLTNKVPLRDSGGAIIGLVGISRDITQRRAMEQALRESENRFRQLAEALPQLIWTCEPDGPCDYVSRQWVQYTGILAEFQLGSGWLEQVHPDDQEALMRCWRAAVAAGSQFQIEFRIRRYDGEYRWFDTRATPLHDAEGRIVKWIGSNTDIHEMRNMRDALQQQAMLIELAHDPICVWDRQSAIVYWNRGCEQLYGYSRREAIGQVSHTLLQTVFPVSLEMLLDQLEREQEWAGELKHTTKDGRTLTVSSRQQNVVLGGRSLILQTDRDVTDHKRTEEYQLRAQKMEALGTLAGGIAHDFNNILLAIAGNTRLSMQDLPADHPLQYNLQEIEQASARATDLVRRILAFSRQQEARREVAQLPPVVDEAVRLLRATLPAMVEIRSATPAQMPRIAADTTQIHQLVINLVTNAAHAIGQRKGVIEVRLEDVDVTREMSTIAADLREARYVRLVVSDDGCGMDAQTLARIFDPFFTTKPVGTGTGLGLSTVHGIVKSHEGAISVYSALHQGTTFHVYFPAVEQAALEHSPKKIELLRGHGERLLYVDDEPALVRLAARMLTRLGYEVEPHTDAARALEAFRTQPEAYDAVITDLSMPRMSGFDFARALLAIRPNVPIVMASGYLRQEDQDTAARIGIRALFLKPNTVEELGGVLQELLGSVRRQGGE